MALRAVPLALRAFQTPAAIPDGSKTNRAARNAVNEVSVTHFD